MIGCSSEESLFELLVKNGNEFSEAYMISDSYQTSVIFAEKIILNRLDELFKEYAKENFFKFVDKLYEKIDYSRLHEYENYFVWELRIIAPQYFEAEVLYNKLMKYKKKYNLNLKKMKKCMLEMENIAKLTQGLDKYEKEVEEIACDICSNFLDNIILITKIKRTCL